MREEVRRCIHCGSPWIERGEVRLEKCPKRTCRRVQSGRGKGRPRGTATQSRQKAVTAPTEVRQVVKAAEETKAPAVGRGDLTYVSEREEYGGGYDGGDF